MGKFNSAIKDLDKAIDLGLNHELAYFYRGQSNYELNNLQKSLDDITNAIKLNPKADHYYAKRGIINFDLDNYQDSLEDFDSPECVGLH